MQARVTAILVARSGVAHLERTLAGLARQTRRPDAIITVDAGSSDGSAELLAASDASQLITVAGKVSFGGAIARAMQMVAPATSEDEWLWLLAHDNAPAPLALEQLLSAVEIAPSVAIAGPKLMRWNQPDVIAEFGETMTKYGASIALVEDELDQAQHDVQDDVMGVAAGGMLVRRSLWTALGGFDPALPSIDAALDFSIRARLAGFRVVVVPGAKVATAGGPELFGAPSLPDRRRTRIARGAQLHRRLTYAAGWTVPLHWLSLVPLAIVRAIGQLLAKRPGAVGGEFATAFLTAFGGSRIFAARRNLKRGRRVSWTSVDALRMPSAEVRERRAQEREHAAGLDVAASAEPGAGFVSHGGLLAVAIAAVVGLISMGPILGASSLSGGTLAPLSGTVAELWAHVGYGWRQIGAGFIGAADPFSYLLAVLGSITFWSPSFSIVLFSVLALPLSALGAWFAARRVTERRWLPFVAALLWSIAPPLLGSLSTGHLGATIAHVLLPWLVLAGLSAARSWGAAAVAALLFAAVGASAPMLVPALLLCWLAWMVARPKRIHRLFGIPIPALVLFAPLVVQQVLRGNPLGLLAEPGVPVGGGETSGLRLALAAPGTGLHGWPPVLGSLSLAPIAPLIVVAALLAPLGLLAILATFVPGSRRAIPSMIIAFLGFATAVACAHLQVVSVGAQAVSIWPGAALSLFWLGILGSAVVGLDALGRASIPLAVFASVTSVLLALPMLGALYPGGADAPATHIAQGGRILPAVVTVEAQDSPQVGTLVLTPQPGGGIAAKLERGSGTTLDDRSTLDATATGLGAEQRRLSTLAANLASRSGYDAAPELARLSVGFVLLAPGHGAVYERASSALDSTALFEPVGKTDNGLLWRYTDAATKPIAPPAGNTSTMLGVGILIAQGFVFLTALLLGVPTSRRRRVQVSGSVEGEPAGTFAEEEVD